MTATCERQPVHVVVPDLLTHLASKSETTPLTRLYATFVVARVGAESRWPEEGIQELAHTATMQMSDLLGVLIMYDPGLRTRLEYCRDQFVHLYLEIGERGQTQPLTVLVREIASDVRGYNAGSLDVDTQRWRGALLGLVDVINHCRWPMNSAASRVEIAAMLDALEGLHAHAEGLVFCGELPLKRLKQAISRLRGEVVRAGNRPAEPLLVGPPAVAPIARTRPPAQKQPSALFAALLALLAMFKIRWPFN